MLQFYETQKDDADGSQGNRERTARKSEKAPRREEELEHSGTIRDDEQKPDVASTAEEEMEIHQQMNQNHKLKEKI